MILLLHMDEEQCYATLHCMIQLSLKEKWYLRVKKVQNTLFVKSFNDILQKKLSPVYKRNPIIITSLTVLDLEQLDYDISQITKKWFNRLFFHYVPFHVSR